MDREISFDEATRRLKVQIESTQRAMACEPSHDAMAWARKHPQQHKCIRDLCAGMAPAIKRYAAKQTEPLLRRNAELETRLSDVPRYRGIWKEGRHTAQVLSARTTVRCGTPTRRPRAGWDRVFTNGTPW